MDNSCLQESAPGRLKPTQSSYSDGDEDQLDQRWTAGNKSTMGQDMYEQRPLLDRLSDTFGLPRDSQDFESYNNVAGLNATSATIGTSMPALGQQDGGPILAYRITDNLTYPYLGQLPLYLPESNLRAAEGPFYQASVPMPAPALPGVLSPALSSALTQPLLSGPPAPAWSFSETQIGQVANPMQMPFCVEETSAWPSPVPSTPASTTLYTEFSVPALPYAGWMEYPVAYPAGLPAGGNLALPFAVEAAGLEQPIKAGSEETASDQVGFNAPPQRWAWQGEHTDQPDSCDQETAFPMAERPTAEMPANYYPSPVADCVEVYEHEVQGSADDKNDTVTLEKEELPLAAPSPVSAVVAVAGVPPDLCVPAEAYTSLARRLPILPQVRRPPRKSTIAPRPLPHPRKEPSSDSTSWSIWDVPTDNEEESQMTRPPAADTPPRPKRVRKTRARHGNAKRGRARRNAAPPPEKTRRTRSSTAKAGYGRTDKSD